MKKHKKHIVIKNEYILLIILVIMVVVMSTINPNFGTLENGFDILRGTTFLGICSIGFLVVLITNGVDISFTASATIGQYLMALAMVKNPETPIVLVILIPIVMGAILGAFNAILINKLRVPAIIVTIAMLNAYYGIIQYFSGGEWLYGFPNWFTKFPNKILISFENERGIIFGLTSIIAIWIVVAIIGYILLKYTRLGRKIYAIGGNETAAKREGINVNRVRIFAYAFLGGVAGIGAIVHAMITQTSAPNALVGQEFNVVAAVVLGGASITGGGGSVVGTLLGVLIIATLKNGLTVLGLPAYYHQIIIGLVLVLSISITATRERLHKKNAGGIDIEEV